MTYSNTYLDHIQPYRVPSHEIWDRTAESRANVLKLDWNESTVPPSPEVARRIRALADDPDMFRLYPATGNGELLSLLAAYTGLPQANIQYYAGSDALQEYIARTYLCPGKRVLILGPSYDNFRLTAESTGTEVTFSEMDADFRFHADRFEQDMDRYAPHLVYLCAPNNPTGTTHTAAYIESLLNRYPASMFLIDEAYSEFCGMTAAPLVKKYPNILISRTMSKAFALANFRVGYVLSDERNLERLSALRNPKSISSFAQQAAIGALSDTAYMQAYVRQVQQARERFADAMRERAPVFTPYAGGGNYVLVKCASPEYRAALAEYLRMHDIYVRVLTQSESLRACIRVTMGTPAQMQRVIDCMDAFVKGTPAC